MRGPGPLRVIGLALTLAPLVLGGLYFLWSLLNSRQKGSGTPQGSVDETLPLVSDVEIGLRLMRSGGTTVKCSDGTFHTSQPGGPSSYISVQHPSVARYSYKLPRGTYGNQCSPITAEQAPNAEVTLYGTNGQVLRHNEENSPRWSYGVPSYREETPMQFYWQVELLTVNGANQPIPEEPVEPVGPAPQVPFLPAAPAPLPASPEPLAPSPLPLLPPQTVPAPQPAPSPNPAQVPITPGVAPKVVPIAPPWVKPGVNPAPGRVPAPAPSPAPSPAPAPAPSPAPGPVPFPSTDPSRPTQPTAPDGSLVPVPAPAPSPTPSGEITVGSPSKPIKIVPRQVPPTLEGIALELGRIERKQEIMLGDPSSGQPDWMDLIGPMAQAVGRLLELLAALDSGTTYTLQSPCEVDAAGNPLPARQVQVPGALSMIGAVMNRCDALAELLQVHKELKQPSCKNPRPQGDPVTVNFEEI